MSEKEKVVNETKWAMSKITDLRDMLDDGMPASVRGPIYRQIEDLEDVVFYNQEYLASLDK